VGEYSTCINKMKGIIVEVGQFFSRKYGLTVSQLNFKLTTKRQIEYCTGLLDFPPTREQREAIEKAYRKKLSSTNYAFLNTELSITENKFSIVNLRP
jgi:hypothetical protein